MNCMGNSRCRVGLVVLGVSLWSASVAADGDAQADALFREGKRLEATDLHAACAHYRLSYARDPMVTTGMVLADCLERDHRLVSAHAMWLDVKRLLERTAAGQAMAGREAIAATVLQRLTQLAPRLSHLRIMVPQAARVEGLVVTWTPPEAVAPEVVADLLWNAELPADGGDHTVTVRAPGFRSWSTTVRIREEMDQAVVDIPRLELEPAVSIPVAPRPGGRARGRGQRIAGLAVGGAGIVGIGVALAFGASARGRWQDAQDAGCNSDGVCPTEAGFQLATDARSAGNLATISVTIGFVAVTTGVVLYLIAPRGRESSVAVTPYLDGAGGGGLAVHGGF